MSESYFAATLLAARVAEATRRADLARHGDAISGGSRPARYRWLRHRWSRRQDVSVVLPQQQSGGTAATEWDAQPIDA